MTEHLYLLDNYLREFFQKQILISINGKTFKSGKFLLFNYNNFFIHLNLINNKKGKSEIVKIPVPFVYEYYKDSGILYFDYRIKTLCRGVIELEKRISNMKRKKESRFWDSILEVGVENE